MVRFSRTLAAFCVAVGAACATSAPGTGSFSGGNDNGGSATLGSSGNATLSNDASLLDQTPMGTCAAGTPCTSGCTDLPSAPVLDPSAPSDAAAQFSGTGLGTGGICIVEPGDGALLPNNWVRPRLRWIPAASQDLFEVRVHADSQKNDLLVYTKNTNWTLPADTWKALAADAWGQDITVTVRGVNSSGALRPAGSQMKFQIAPALANGSMIYWAAVGDKNGDSWLEGFTVGDETVLQVLNTSQVGEKLSRDSGGNLTTQNQDTHTPLANGAGSTQCIGCHAAVPDQNSVTFLDFYPWPGVAADVHKGAVGDVPSWLTPGGAEALALPWIGMMTFSSAVWDTGRHIVVAGWQVGPNDIPWQGGGTTAPSNLVWIDLSTSQPQTLATGGVPWSNLMNQGAQQFVTNNLGKSYGYIARNGDSQGASCPSWSHDGQHIAYVSNNAAKDGRLQNGTADIYTVPYAGNAGGQATPVAGASDPSMAEYYPWYSPDDKYIAFDRAPGSELMYYNPHSEVYVVPSGGGTATRLAANDAPSCMGVTSPGITNSWPKWSPQATACNGKTYYWLIFSSSRLNLPFDATNFKMGLPTPNEPTSQLYLTAIVDDGTGHLTTYPGVYIWNQPTTGLAFPGSNQSNHTPLWDVVMIPPAPPPK